MKSVLILGARGMLGQELVRAFKRSDTNNANQHANATNKNQKEWEVTAWDREDLDLTNEKETREKIMTLWPDVIINAAAYNLVDACEESEKEYAKAQKLNTEVPGLLADIANDLQAVIAHYSTDYVFDGNTPRYDPSAGSGRTSSGRAPGCCGSGCAGCNYNDPKGEFEGYKEYDLPNPLSKYGKTKWEGEKLVAKNCPDNHYIIRLSKLFGKPAQSEDAKRSFFDVMLEKARSDTNNTNQHANATNGNAKKESIKVVDGEISNFTYAPDLAQKTREIVEKEMPAGIYHITNSGAVTWYEAAKKLFEIAGLTVEVEPVLPDEFPRPAKRPEKSVLLSSKLDPLRPWDEALEEYLKNPQNKSTLMKYDIYNLNLPFSHLT